MGPMTAKKFKTLLLPQIVLIFLLDSPRKTTFGIFQILTIEISQLGPYGSQNFKTLHFLQIAAKIFQTCPKFSSRWSSQNYVENYEEL